MTDIPPSARPLPPKYLETIYTRKGWLMSYMNGMLAASIIGVTWVKSTRSYDKDWHDCVQLAALPDGGVAVRNSRDPEGPALVFTRSEMSAFVCGARDGEFDWAMDR